MYTFALAIVVVIGIYFLYNQLSNLNLLLEKIIIILKNNKAVISENSDKIIDDIYDTHTDINKSMFDPETIISKLVNPSNIEQDVPENNELETEQTEEEIQNNVEHKNIETASSSESESIEELNGDELGNTITQTLQNINELEANEEISGDLDNTVEGIVEEEADEVETNDELDEVNELETNDELDEVNELETNDELKVKEEACEEDEASVTEEDVELETGELEENIELEVNEESNIQSVNNESINVTPVTTPVTTPVVVTPVVEEQTKSVVVEEKKVKRKYQRKKK